MENIDSLIDSLSSTIRDNCTSDAAVSMFANQLEDLKKHVEWLCIPEKEIDDKIQKLKFEIYNFYKFHISVILNKYEVYFHNFPENASDMLSEIVLDISKIVDPKFTYNDKIYILQKVQKVNFVLYYTIGIELIKYYIKQIKTYKQVLTKFNYMAVKYYDKDKFFKDEVKIEEGKIKKLYKDIKKKYKTFFKCKNKDGSYEYDLDNIVQTLIGDKEIIDVLMDELVELVKDFEYHYPKIVDCGYNTSLLRKFFSCSVFIIIPVALSIIALLRWIA